jgi:hypothetical protein
MILSAPATVSEPMRDNKSRSCLRSLGNGLLDEHFVFRVEEACGLVQEDDRRVFQQCAGNRDPLALATRKRAAVFTSIV